MSIPAPSGLIDLRSDTVTHPTEAMRRAMAAAEVGDDQLREDPTVTRLEERAADLFGMEAALLVTSGTMGNLVSLLTHCGRGEGALLGDQSHIVWYENSGAAVLGGVVYQLAPTDRSGELAPGTLAGMIRPGTEFEARTRVIAIEDTHNRRGGTVLSLDYLRELRRLADDAGIRIHMDGARVFNAAVASGQSLAEIAANVDTIQFCLSKGLAAPIGSMIAGPREFIEVARQRRRLVGGAMRQAGVIAAAGLVALDEMRDRLAEDHQRARRLAEGLASIPGVTIDLESVQSNIVIFRPDTTDFAAVSAAFRAEGVLSSGFGPLGLRMVTHYQIDDAAIERTLAVASAVLTGRTVSATAAGRA